MSPFIKLIIFPNLLLALFSISIDAATFVIVNNCSYTVRAVASPGGGQQLDPGGRVWARTGCSLSISNGASCQSGNCGGLLQCQGYDSLPNTLAEYSLNQYSNLDFFDISLIDGFNVPMSFLPISNGCTQGPTCAADVNSQCPIVLKAPGGCNNPCTVFKTDEYCCNSGSCNPTDYSRYFKGLCPDAYSYPKDDVTSTYTCPGGTNYKVVFCP
ncbi:hypothetical protein Nepgr_024564 [Nepenthes gracilis]|uniref:Thaumatin-like protein n=1 Tax=Nepenthes gracilis TaxID=150966 RepID=A0AAD3T518_NEPGR|nr:hypothetical protein Nepgr_024564 [Nepenthes gracilis]